MPAPALQPDTAAPAVHLARLHELVETAGAHEGPALLRELLNVFCAEARLHHPALCQSCAAGDAAVARREAHFLAGSSANLGLLRLAAWMRALEARARDGDFFPMPGFDRELDRQLADACGAFEEAVAGLERR